MDKTTLCLSIHTLMGILDCFHFLALKNNVAETFVYNFLCKHICSFLLCVCLGVEFLPKLFEELIPFSKVAVLFYIPIMRVLISPNPY